MIKKRKMPILTTSGRLVVKIGSALLVDERTGEIRHEWLDKLADDIAYLKNKGKDVHIYKGKDLLAKVKGAKGDLSKKGKYFV